MTSYFHSRTAFNFFEFLSTLARSTGSGFHLHIKTGNHVKHLSITFQNLKTKLKNQRALSAFRSSQKAQQFWPGIKPKKKKIRSIFFKIFL